MIGTAYLSMDRQFRYWLARQWNGMGPWICFIGLNPSTADEKKNDHTVTKEINFATRWGFGGMLKLNIGAYRSTDPKRWRKATDPIGTENSIQYLVNYISKFSPSTIVAAWGRNGRYAEQQCLDIISGRPDLQCFGFNKDGSPVHPLMLPYSTELQPFSKGERT